MRTTITAAAVAVLLTACAKPGPPPKLQPGSYSVKTELVDAQGPGSEQIKAMAPMMAAATKSICVTPDMSAKSDVVKDFTGTDGNCKFDKNDVTSAGLHVSGTCTKNGQQMTIAMDGSLSSTAQDVTADMQMPNPMGGGNVNLKLRVSMQRTGECKPGDITPPAGGTLGI